MEAKTLPASVLDDGNTEDHCVDGALDDVFGLAGDAPSCVAGELAVLDEGDCLVLPAGLYHDVECDPAAGPSVSLTIRFEFPAAADDDAAPAAAPSAGGKGDLKKFLMRLALKKAMLNKAAANPATPNIPSPQPTHL